MHVDVGACQQPNSLTYIHEVSFLPRLNFALTVLFPFGDVSCFTKHTQVIIISTLEATHSCHSELDSGRLVFLFALCLPLSQSKEQNMISILLPE